MANGRCRMHGGAIPRGIALPQTTHGRYSKSIPARLAGKYQEAVTDPRLLELREDVSLIDARLSDVLARVDTGESGILWSALYDARSAALLARSMDDKVAQSEAINEMMRLIGQGHADYAAWHEVTSLLQQRRRLVESERKRLVEANQMVTAEKAMLLMGAVVGIIRQHVQDPKQLNAIANAIDALTMIEGGE